MIKQIFLNNRLILIIVILNVILFYTDQLFLTKEMIKITDAVFTSFFCLEAVVKIQSLGWSNYWSDSWNKFDFVIIAFALPSLINLFVDESILTTNVLFIFRVFRVFKSFLLFKHIPNMSRILNGVKLAFKSSFVVGVAFMSFLIVSSVISYVIIL